MKYEDIQVEGEIRSMLWGGTGVGKTTLVGGFPGLAIVDMDNGLKTYKGKWYLANRPKPDIIEYETFDNDVDEYGLFKSVDGFWNAIKFVNTMLKNDAVKTIVIDSLSTFQALAMQVGIKAAGEAKGRSQTYAMAKGIPGGKPGSHVLLPTQADFGAEMSVFEQFMNQLIKHKKNIVCIAHDKDITTESGALLRKEPYLIGTSIRALVAKWFDEVWYMELNNKGERVLRTQQTSILKVNKSRLGVEDGMIDPTYEKIMKSLQS